MGMGTRRRRQRQEQMWIAQQELAKGPAHPFYKRVNELLEERKFDEFAERECAKFYAENIGRPSLAPGIYFRLLLVGYFEGLDSERGIAWRVADSLGLRRFLGIGIDEPTPDHSTISRTRRLIDVETHHKVFFWILEVLREQGLVKGIPTSHQRIVPVLDTKVTQRVRVCAGLQRRRLLFLVRGRRWSRASSWRRGRRRRGECRE